MGLLELVTGRVLIEYKADTKDAVAKVRELSGEQKKAAKETAESMQRQSEALEKFVGRATFAIGAVVGAVAIAKAGFESWTKQTNLEAATTGVSLDKLAKAAGGLKTNIELLEFAAAGVNGRWKLTQQEMEAVLVGMRALEKQGRESAQVSKAIGDAILKGEVEPLKELGVTFDETIAKTDKKRAALEALATVARSAGGDLDKAGDAQRRMGVQAENAFHQIRVAIGQMVNAATPAIQAFADMAVQLGRIAGGIARIVDEASDLPGAGVVGWGVRNAWRFTPHGNLVTAGEYAGGWLGGGSVDSNDPFYRRDPEAEARVLSRYADTSTPGAAYLSPQQRQDAMFYLETALARGESSLRRGNRAASRARARARGRGTARSPAFDITSLGPVALDLLSGGYDVVNQGLEDFGQIELGPSQTEQQLAEIRAAFDGLSGLRVDLDKIARDRNESVLQRMFGPISEFEAYSEGFKLLTSVATTAFDAWITGSMSIGKALKSALAEGIRGIASDMLAKSIHHAAYAVGSLAFGDLRGAAQHGKAAGVFAAGALAAGAIARGLGAGDSPQQASAGSSRSAAGIGLGGGSSNRHNAAVTVVLGDGMSDSSPRYVGRRTRRAINLARRYAESDGAVPG